MNILKTIIGLRVRAAYAYRAMRAINQPHLGDVVMYKGKRHVLNQGVNSPYWDLIDLSTDNMAKRVRDVERGVHVRLFKLQPLHKRFWFSFRFTYKFWMRSWYMIDVNKRMSKYSPT